MAEHELYKIVDKDGEVFNLRDSTKLGKTGDSSNTTSTFTKDSGDTSSITSGSKLSAIFTAISSFFASLKSLAFKDKVTDSDISGTISDSHIASESTWNGKYTKPSTGIPKTDLASAVQTSLGKADTALQSHQDISGKADKANITGATKCKITYNSQGIVTAGANLTASDIPSLAASKITSGTFGTDRIADDAITADKVKDNETLPVNITGSSGSCTGNAATATTATNADITRTADTTNGDKLQIGTGTAVNITNAKHAASADTATNYADGGGIANALAGKSSSSHLHDDRYIRAGSGNKSLSFGGTTTLGTVNGKNVNLVMPAANADTYEVFVDSTSFTDVLTAFSSNKKLLLKIGKEGGGAYRTEYRLPLYRIQLNGNVITQFVWMLDSDAYGDASGSNTFGAKLIYKLSESGWSSSSDNVDFAKAAATAYGGTADYLKMLHTNEVNFKNVPTAGNKGRLWFNFRNGDTDAADSANPITDYYFGDRNNGTNTTLHAARLAGSADKWNGWSIVVGSTGTDANTLYFV